MIERLVLTPEPTAAKAARAFLADTCRKLRDDDVLRDAQLLVTELVSNAIRHGALPIEVAVCCSDAGSIQVWVHDRAAGRPRRITPGPDDEGGRGLNLLHALSDAWGVDDVSPGKAVWFRMASRRA